MPGRRRSSSRTTRSIVERREPDPRPARRGADPDVGRRSTRSQDFKAAKDDEVVLASQATPRWIAPHFVWAVRDELADEAVRRGRPAATPSNRGGLRVTTTLDVEPPEDRREVGRGRGDPCRTGSDTGRSRGRQGARLRRSSSRGCGTSQQGPPQRRARRARLPDRRARRLRRQRGLLRDLDKPEIPAAVRRRRQGLPPARFGVQAVQLRGRHRRQGDHRRARC